MAKKMIRKLQLGVLVSVTILIVSSFASYYSLQKQLDNRESLSKARRSISAVKDLLLVLVDAETGNRGYQLTGDASFLDSYYNSVRTLPTALANLKELRGKDPLQGPRIVSLEEAVSERLSILKSFIEKKKQGETISNQDLLYSRKYMDLTRFIVADFVKHEEEQLEIHGVQLKKSTTITGLVLLTFMVMALIVIAYLYFKLKNDILSRDVLQKSLEEKDRLISNKIHAIQLVANQVAKGDFSQRAIAEEKDDLGELATSLNNMTDSLKKSFDQINKSDWYQKGLAQINEVLVGNKKVREVTKLALQHLVEYGNSVSGALYVAEDDRLVLASAYGLEDHMKHEFLTGEGILGQAFKLKSTRIYNNILDNDRVASFATSTLKINAIIIIPIMFGRKAIGIVELASGNPYPEEHILYYEECCRNIGIALSAAISREEKEKLLKSTQIQANELKQKHEEMENLNAELEAQAQKLQASEEELRVQQEELVQSNMELAERSKSLEEVNLKIAERNKEISQKVKELAASTKYKSEFLANMSHELRTPLNSILLLSRMLAENSDQTLTSEQIESANVILSSGKSLLTLIDEILDLAKIESGKMTVDLEEVAIEEVTKDLQNMFQPLTNEKELALNFEIQNDVNDTIITDRQRLDQVLRNLISNAIKFTSKGGVNIIVSNDEAWANHVAIRVKDSGIGIPQEQQTIIFEAFQQADGSTRRKYGGTGLGLSISKEISKLLGGDLSVESIVNEGSTFILRIPTKPEYSLLKNNEQGELEDLKLTEESYKEQEALKELSSSNSIQTRDKLNNQENIVSDDRELLSVHDQSILIVEDDIPFAKVLLNYTRQQGYKGIVVTSGEHVTEIAHHYLPVAILLDIHLPIKDGWQILSELKQKSSTKRIPVHMMSSSNVRTESLQKGADNFIDKPIALDEMATLFQNIEEKRIAEKSKILIVEENTKHAQALHWYLESKGFRSFVSTTEDEAIRSLRDEEIDCVILNVQNDEISILDKIKYIKEIYKTSSLTTIMLIDQPLSVNEELKIKKFADSIVVKTAHSYQRILDEVGLFLHTVEQKPDKDNNQRGTEIIVDSLKGKKVLVTDDDVRNIFSITKVLESYKMEVSVAMDGQQALDVLAENTTIDVILMDMMMPEMDGYEAIKEIRKNPRFKNIPIIAVTAKSMLGERDKCIEAGASDYITKPVDTDQLLSLLRVWLY